MAPSRRKSSIQSKDGRGREKRKHCKEEKANLVLFEKFKPRLVAQWTLTCQIREAKVLIFGETVMYVRINFRVEPNASKLAQTSCTFSPTNSLVFYLLYCCLSKVGTAMPDFLFACNSASSLTPEAVGQSAKCPLPSFVDCGRNLCARHN